MAGGAAGEPQCLSYTGCNFLRQRLVLATLSGRPLKIRKIRAKEEDPGLRGERRHRRPRGRRSGGGGAPAPAVPGTGCRAGATPQRELRQPGLHLGWSRRGGGTQLRTGVSPWMGSPLGAPHTHLGCSCHTWVAGLWEKEEEA